MSKIADKLTDLIGNTPLLALNNYGKALELEAKVLAKLEYFNPAGSAKDRVAVAMIEAAEKEGLLKVGSTIIEPTSGNTGIPVLSLISLLCCSPLSIVGLILSIVGLTKAKDCDGNGKGLAIAGIIISAIAIVFCIIALLIYGAAIVESAGSSY